ncbi:MAG: zinc-binding dehydrogenase [Roseibacillus sp.]|nr:zinc-binding dehydrogenase [Roseibacillus sp.]
MKAIVLTSTDGTVDFIDVDDPTIKPGTVMVKLKAAGLNRRDYWITQGLYPGMHAPSILGSDGAGVVEEVGQGVEDSWLGREVIIYPGTGWGPSSKAQSEDFRILGMPDNGTFAEWIVVPAEQLVVKPEDLSIHEAATVPIAGLTAYRALFPQGRLQSGETVLITGIGGGVAVMILKLAAASGAKVLVTSSSPQKLERALSLGATAGANYKEENWTGALAEHGPIDLVIDGSAGVGFNDLLGLVRPGGRIVNYGGTAGPPEHYDIRRHFWKQIHVIGSTFGSPDDLVALMEMIELHSIRPEIDSVTPLSEGAEVIASMAKSPQFGKLVLEMP